METGWTASHLNEYTRNIFFLGSIDKSPTHNHKFSRKKSIETSIWLGPTQLLFVWTVLSGLIIMSSERWLIYWHMKWNSFSFLSFKRIEFFVPCLLVVLCVHRHRLTAVVVFVIWQLIITLFFYSRVTWFCFSCLNDDDQTCQLRSSSLEWKFLNFSNWKFIVIN